LPATNAPLITTDCGRSKPGGRSFSPLLPASTALAAEQHDHLLGAIETTGFFNLLRTHTVLGFFGPPSYGGNRDQVGWKLIGFEDRASVQPPFGYYDAESGR
jgi:gluconate 2-dehydrogenase subunit 3-like protein